MKSRSEVTHIPTRYALVKRAVKLLKEIDGYFRDAEAFGVSAKDADPNGEMTALRQSIIKMLEREKALGLVKW